MRRLFPTAPEEPRVPLAPLIDVIFLVLATFIEATLFLTEASGVPIVLPAAASAEPSTASSTVTVTVDDAGRIFLDRRSLDLDRLEDELRRRVAAVPELTLHLRADRDARVEPLVAVLDRARRAGVATLVVAAEPRAGEASP